MLNLKTANFPFAALLVPPKRANAPLLVVVEKLVPAVLFVVPEKAVISAPVDPVAGRNQLLDPLDPSK